MSHVIFGEVTSNNNESDYTWANTVTLTLLYKLKDIKEFESVSEADIVNASLVFFNLFFNLHIDVKSVEETQNVIREMAFDEKTFKNFFNMAINHGKMHNIMLNDGIYKKADINGF